MEHTGQSRFVEFRVYRKLDKRYDRIIENVQYENWNCLYISAKRLICRIYIDEHAKCKQTEIKIFYKEIFCV